MTTSKTQFTAPDVQAQLPSLPISLSRVGVTGVEKVVRIATLDGDQLFMAKMECFVDLGPDQKGAHMSRFEETVNDVISEVVFGASQFRIERVAERIASLVRERQNATRAEVNIEARYPEHKPAPISGIETQEIYTLLGSAVAYENATKRVIGVQAQGMTACPCAQQIVAGKALEDRVVLTVDRVSPMRTSTVSSKQSQLPLTTSVALAHCTSACPQAATLRLTRGSFWTSSKTQCPLRSTR